MGKDRLFMACFIQKKLTVPLRPYADAPPKGGGDAVTFDAPPLPLSGEAVLSGAKNR